MLLSFIPQKPKRTANPKLANKKKIKTKRTTKTKPGKKNKVSDKVDKVANGTAKEDLALMDNAGFEDTEMTEIKVEIPEDEEENEVSYARMSTSPHSTL